MSNKVFQSSVEVNLAAIHRVVEGFAQFCMWNLACSPDNTERIVDLKIALVELLNNIMLHACNNDLDHQIYLEASFKQDRLKLLVYDDGVELPKYLIDPQSIHSPILSSEELPERGFGWFLIHQVFEVGYYNREGNVDQGGNCICLIEKLDRVSQDLMNSNAAPLKLLRIANSMGGGILISTIMFYIGFMGDVAFADGNIISDGGFISDAKAGSIALDLGETLGQ